MTSLFDSPENWRLDPANAFAAFVLAPEFLALSKRRSIARDANGEPTSPATIRGSSAKIYILMFGKFLRWLSEHNKTLFDVSSADLMAFLEQGRGVEGKKVLNSVLRFQYVSVLDRVYTHLKVHNPAQDACFAIFKSGNRALLGTNQQKVVLTDAQQIGRE